MGSDLSLGIREIQRRPVVVVECAPDRVLAVHRDRVFDPQRLRLLANVVHVSLKRKFRRMNADHHQAFVAVFLSPGTNIGKRPQPVDAGKGPEVDKNDFPPQISWRQRLGINPPRCAGKRSELTFDRQLRGPDLELPHQLIVDFDRLAWRFHPGRVRPGKRELLGFHARLPPDANPSTSMSAWAKACGASCGRLCPMPPVVRRCSYFPANFPAYALAGGWNAPLASPSSVMAGTVMTGPLASRCSSSSYWGSPGASPSRQR